MPFKNFQYFLVATLVAMVPAKSFARQASSNQSTVDARATLQRDCGSCHGLDIILGAKKSKDEWTASVNDMITKGAKVTPDEFGQIIDYLAALPSAPAVATPQGEGPAATPAPRITGPGRPGGPGPLDRQVVDPAAAAKGRTLYIAECVTCHGADARGAADEAPPSLQGPDLVRSTVVFHDRYGSALGPFLKKGHPLQSGKPSADLSNDQIVALSHFLHKQIDDTLSGGAYTHILNVLTGNAKAGEAYFNGAGKCNQCHSPTGDLAHIGKRFDPPTLQQQFVFPRTITRDSQGKVTAPKPVTVTVVDASGKSISGVLDQLDDFSVSLTDPSGNYHAWTRTPNLKVEKHDPYQAHIELLDQLTDKNIHDIVAYLETLQ